MRLLLSNAGGAQDSEWGAARLGIEGNYWVACLTHTWLYTESECLRPYWWGFLWPTVATALGRSILQARQERILGLQGKTAATRMFGVHVLTDTVVIHVVGGGQV